MHHNPIAFSGPRDLTVMGHVVHDAIKCSLFGYPDLVIHGDCPSGVDMAVDAWAEIHNIKKDPHPADFNLFGYSAGPMRNEDMVRIARACIVIRDVERAWTKGSYSFAKYALKHRRPLYIHNVSIEQKGVWYNDRYKPSDT